MNLTLIRHTAVDVPKGVCYGQSDVPLKDLDNDAKEVCKNLTDNSFDKVFSSPLSRCTLLAKKCGYTNFCTDNRLMEMNCGALERCRFDEITDPRLQLWYEDYLNVAPTEGESFIQMQQRVLSFVEELKKENYTDVAIVTHGGVILQFQLLLGIISTENMFDYQTPYGGIVRLTI